MDPSSGTPQLPARLRSAAEALNRESDALTNSLKLVEQALKSLGLGIEAQLQDPVHEEDEWIDECNKLHWKIYLGYAKRLGKSNNEWGLYIESDSDGGPDGVTQGIAELSRENRILMAKHLPALLDLMAVQAEKLVHEVQAAAVAANDAAAKLDLPKPERVRMAKRPVLPKPEAK